MTIFGLLLFPAIILFLLWRSRIQWTLLLKGAADAVRTLLNLPGEHIDSYETDPCYAAGVFIVGVGAVGFILTCAVVSSACLMSLIQ